MNKLSLIGLAALTIFILAGVLFFSCTSGKPLSTVQKLDLERYSGTWYEIARLPNRFEKDLKCVTANYTLKDDGNIRVENRGYHSKKEEFDNIVGRAWLADPAFPGRIKVSFFGPFAADYYVIALDDDYQYALVGTPSRKFLWVLAREKTMPESKYNELLEIATSRGFKVSELEKIAQDCGN